MQAPKLERILKIVRGKESANGQYLGFCPAHKDGRPSLAIKDRGLGKSPLLFCFAGCSYQQIVKEIRKVEAAE